MYTTSTTGWSTINDPLTGTSISALVIGGDNPLLDPEKADTLTAGFTWAPASAPGLIMSVDYFDIEIKDVITQVSGTGNGAALYRRQPGLVWAHPARWQHRAHQLQLRQSGRVPHRRRPGPALQPACGKLFPAMSGNFRTRVLATWTDNLTTYDA